MTDFGYCPDGWKYIGNDKCQAQNINKGTCTNVSSFPGWYNRRNWANNCNTTWENSKLLEVGQIAPTNSKFQMGTCPDGWKYNGNNQCKPNGVNLGTCGHSNAQFGSATGSQSDQDYRRNWSVGCKTRWTNCKVDLNYGEVAPTTSSNCDYPENSKVLDKCGPGTQQIFNSNGNIVNGNCYHSENNATYSTFCLPQYDKCDGDGKFGNMVIDGGRYWHREPGIHGSSSGNNIGSKLPASTGFCALIIGTENSGDDLIIRYRYNSNKTSQIVIPSKYKTQFSNSSGICISTKKDDSKVNIEANVQSIQDDWGLTIINYTYPDINVSITPEKPTSCPDNWNHEKQHDTNTRLACTKGWSANCDETCVRNQCSNLGGQFPNLDFTKNKYRCMIGNDGKTSVFTIRIPNKIAGFNNNIEKIYIYPTPIKGNFSYNRTVIDETAPPPAYEEGVVTPSNNTTTRGGIVGGNKAKPTYTCPPNTCPNGCQIPNDGLACDGEFIKKDGKCYKTCRFTCKDMETCKADTCCNKCGAKKNGTQLVEIPCADKKFIYKPNKSGLSFAKTELGKFENVNDCLNECLNNDNCLGISYYKPSSTNNEQTYKCWSLQETSGTLSEDNKFDTYYRIIGQDNDYFNKK